MVEVVASKCHKETYKMIENERVLNHIFGMLKDINDQYNFSKHIKDGDLFKSNFLDYLEKNQSKVMSFIYSNNELGMKKFLINNFINPTLFPEQNQPVKKIKVEPVIVEEIKPRGKGRPKGSKNKPKEIKTNIPIHTVNDQNFIDAIKDILWYSNGLMAKQIIDHLEHDESITKFLYAKLHEYKNTHWVEKRITGRYGKPIFKWYPIGERKGFFYAGKLRSITNMAEHIGMNKVTLWKRIKSGMNHIEAINKPIDDKMVRNGKNS